MMMKMMEIRKKIWDEIESAIKKEIGDGRNLVVAKSWADGEWDVDSIDANILQDVEDAIKQVKMYGIDAAFKFPKEMWEALRDHKDVIKYFPVKYEKPVERDCFCCGERMKVEHWIERYRRKMGNSEEDAIRLWNNDMVFIACCNCYRVNSKDELLEAIVRFIERERQRDNSED